MNEVFDKKIHLGDLVLPVYSYKINVDNYKSRVGIVVGEDEIYVKKKQINTYYYSIVKVDNCMLLDLTPELEEIKKELQISYKNYSINKIKSLQKLNELGSGTIFCKQDKEDWNNAYVYIGYLTSEVTNQLIVPNGNLYSYLYNYSNYKTDMCFENKYLYIPYATVLGAVLCKNKTTKDDKLNYLNKEVDMSKVYRRLVEQSFVSNIYISKESPLKVGKVLGRLNLQNIEYTGEKTKNGVLYNMNIRFANEIE